MKHRIWIPALLIINFIWAIFWVLLISGNLSLKGLQLTGAIKSTLSHKHCEYDNDFIKGTYWQDDSLLVDGSSIRAKDIRAVSSSVMATYMINEGVMYQHGALIFAEEIYYPPLIDKNGNIVRDKDGNIVKDILAVPQFYASGKIGIYPDYKNEGIRLMGAYVDKDGVHNIAPQEIERIRKILEDE